MSADAEAPGGGGSQRSSSDDEPTEVMRPADDADTEERESSDIGKAKTIADDEIGAASTDPAMRGRTPRAQDVFALRSREGAREERPRTERKPVRRGEVIGGRYRVVRLIARGSMSRVYEAQQISVRRPVALKIMSERFARDEQALGRFRREAAVLAQIDHPNVVTVHDIGTTDEGEHYLVMEYVEGAPMSEIVKEEGRLSATRTVGLLLQIARALARVHGAGVIHRDLKPKNVLLATGHRGVEVAKVVDFGLAKATQEPTGSPTLTRAGTILGTPEYMAPEQVKGATVDRRADIYSLGCVAYEMLTGRPPFIGEEMSILYRQMNEQPQPMRDVCQEAEIPEPFQEFVDGALAKQADERYQSASELYNAALEAFDAAGLQRSDLHLTESLYDDPTLVSTGEARAVSVGGVHSTGELARDRSAPKRRLELALGVGILAIAALVAGILLERALRSTAAHETSGTAPAAARELLLVNSNPEGASVELDGRILPETTPTAIRGIAAGEHTVRLHKDGHSAVERSVSIREGGRAALDVQLPGESREVTVRTIPGGALVFLNGRLVSSQTPATLTLTTADFHSIRVEKNGFEPAVARVTPDDRDPELTLTLAAEKRPIGWLWIDSNDTAEVWIDGRNTGFIAPTSGLRVEAGRHVVELRDASGARSRPVRFTVRRGESIHLTLGLGNR